MTQIYLGNDTYEVYFNSGIRCILSRSDIEELVDDSEIVAEIKEDLYQVTEVKDNLEGAIEEHLQVVRELEGILFEMDRFSTKLRRKSHQDEHIKLRNTLEDKIEHLDILAEFI